MNEDSNFAPAQQLRWMIIGALWVELCLALYLYRREYSHITSITTSNVSLEKIVAIIGNDYTPRDLYVAGNLQVDLLWLAAGMKLCTSFLWLAIVYFSWLPSVWSVTKEMTGIWPSFVPPRIAWNMSFAILCNGGNTLLQIPFQYVLVTVQLRHGLTHRKGDILKTCLMYFILDLVPVGYLAGLGAWVLDTLDSRPLLNQVLILTSFTFLFVVLVPSFFVSFLLSLDTLAQSIHTSEGTREERALAQICGRVHFPKKHIYLLQLPTLDRKWWGSLACYYGFLWFHRIAVSRKLVQGHSQAGPGKRLSTIQLKAVVAHELGHWHHDHSNKSLSLWHLAHISIALLIFWLRSKVVLFQALGFQFQTLTTTNMAIAPSKAVLEEGLALMPGIVISFYCVASIYYHVFGAFHHLQMRDHELQADAFAADLGYGTELREALVKITWNHKSFPSSDLWYSVCYHSHPCVLERARFLMLQTPQEEIND